ncbi:KAP family P-loop NTPase fold protein [Tenacibaculum maritimum]|uniref:KAP family P-loop NTPase fold protein n=2 Tax=Tenacibaculum maritimum TaxID=107401 RepID=UPI0038774D07
MKLISYIKKKKSNTNDNHQLLDTHIKSEKQDTLNRSQKAKRVYKEIQELKSEETSISIGIVGEWGTGKTSFLEMIKEQFQINKSKDYILIDFNPWLNISLNSILQDFFNTLEKSLKEYSFDVSKNIRKYSNSVLSIHKNDVTESVLKGINLILKSSLTEEFNNLNDLLKKLNKRIVIIIDDFDRLQANEIFEILKLIRNTAGFDTFTYVVAYDKEYLVKSLKNNNIPNPEKFTEKIFLREIELLPVTNIQINNSLKQELLKYFPSHKNDIDDFFDGLRRRFYPVTSTENITWSLKHLRDVKRFLSSFINDFQIIKDEVYFRDYLIIKLLKFKFYNVYSLLFTNRDDFVTIKNDGKKPGYILQPQKEGVITSSFDEFKGSKIEVYIKESLKYKDEEIASIGILLNNLFTKSTIYKHNLSISQESNYYKYFKDELSNEDLSIKEFEKVMTLPFEEIKIKMNDWYNKGKLENARVHLYDTNIYELKNRMQYENYIKSMVHISKYKIKSIRGEEILFGFDFSILWNNINNRRNCIVEKYYSNVNELKKFVKSIFEEAKSPYKFEADLCYYIDDFIDINSDVVDKNTVRGYLVNYFEKYISKLEKTDENFWTLFYLCRIGNYIETSNNTWVKENVYLDDAITVFKNYMIKNLDYFLVIFVSTQPFYRDRTEDFKTGVDEIAKSIFGSFEKFLEFLKSDELKNNLIAPSEFLEEFTTFTEQYIEKGMMLPFKFTYIPVLEKLDAIIKRQNY